MVGRPGGLHHWALGWCPDLTSMACFSIWWAGLLAFDLPLRYDIVDVRQTGGGSNVGVLYTPRICPHPCKTFHNYHPERRLTTVLQITLITGLRQDFCATGCSEVTHWTSRMPDVQRPDLQNSLRQSYDHLTIMPVTIDLRRMSNLQSTLRRKQGFS